MRPRLLQAWVPFLGARGWGLLPGPTPLFPPGPADVLRQEDSWRVKHVCAAPSRQPLPESAPGCSGQAGPQAWDSKAQEEPGSEMQRALAGDRGLGLAPEASFSPGQWRHFPGADPGWRCPLHTRQLGAPGPGPAPRRGPRWAGLVSGQAEPLHHGPCCVASGGLEAGPNNVLMAPRREMDSGGPQKEKAEPVRCPSV